MKHTDLFTDGQDMRLPNMRAVSVIERDFGGFCRRQGVRFHITPSHISDFNHLRIDKEVRFVSVSREGVGLPWADDEVAYEDLAVPLIANLFDRAKGLGRRHSSEMARIDRAYQSYTKLKGNALPLSGRRSLYAPIQRVHLPAGGCVYVARPQAYNNLDSDYLGFAHLPVGAEGNLQDRIRSEVHYYSAWLAGEINDISLFKDGAAILTKSLVPTHSTTIQPMKNYLLQLQAMQELVRQYRELFLRGQASASIIKSPPLSA